MEPLDDKELSHLLNQWKAPETPAGLEDRVLRRITPSWRWLLTGTIRIPVPVGLAVLVAVAFLLYFRTPVITGRSPQPGVSAQTMRPVSLSDFQPVRQLEPKIIGRANESN